MYCDISTSNRLIDITNMLNPNEIRSKNLYNYYNLFCMHQPSKFIKYVPPYPTHSLTPSRAFFGYMIK